MAEQSGDAVVEAGQAAAQPVLGEWGWVNLIIKNNHPVQGLAIGSFFQSNRNETMQAVRRAIERKDPNNPDQRADPWVGEGMESGSLLLVPVTFYSELGYEYFNSIFNGLFLMCSLKTELEKIGYQESIKATVEDWELPNKPEEGSESSIERGLDNVIDWMDGIPERVSVLSPPAGDSGIPEDVSSVAASSTVTSRDKQQQPPTPAQGKRPSAQAALQEGPVTRKKARLQMELKKGPLTRKRAEEADC